MALIPIEEILYRILRRHHTDFEQILGKTVTFDELESLLLNEGFSKEAVRGYIQERKMMRTNVFPNGFFTGGVLR